MDTLKQLISQGKFKLPSPPSVALRLLEVVKKEDFSFVEIARIIQYDPALTAKVLRVVNSAFYSLPEKVGSIDRALPIIGVHAVKNIAFSFTLIQSLSVSSDDVFNIDYFWKRSIISAIGAELFSEYFRLGANDLFAAALLQDLGILILHSNYLDDYSRLIERKNALKVPIEDLEREQYGFTHQELCSEVMDQWGLPEGISLPVRHHHHYHDAPREWRQAARILFLANALSSIFSDIESYDKIKHFFSVIKDDLGISEPDLEALIDRGGVRVVELCSQFQIPSEEIKPLAILLHEANEGLCALNLSYERLLKEYVREKMQAEKLALELKEAANRDYLTGLYNRRYLVDFLEQEIHRVERYEECFSLLMFDIDFFKQVNDTYGHQKGDLVLQAVSDKVTGIKRITDLLARYGGEEFVMVMPRTGLREAALFAERLRKTIEEMVCLIDGHIIRITISAGVAACGPKWKDMTISGVLDRADRALYEAKKYGRNRVVSTSEQ